MKQKNANRTKLSADKKRSDRNDNKRAAVHTASAEELRIGDRIVVTIKRLGINGEGVGYYRRKAVFIDGALPDEVVKAEVVRIEPNRLYARPTEWERRSPDRIEPACPAFGECGGCQLQHLSYSGQLKAKEELVREAFSRYAGLEDLPLKPIIGMESPWGYRNKAQLQTERRAGEMLLGLYAPGTNRLTDISGCPIQHPLVNEIMAAVKDIFRELGIAVRSGRRNAGAAVRTVVARVSTLTGEAQLTLVTASPQLPKRDELLAAIRKRLPRVVTIAQNINPEDTPLVFGEKTVLLWGKERLEETLGELRFDLSPRAFFQLNPEQTVKLYGAVRELAALSGSERVVDAYCGTGTIALWLAPDAAEVRGIEVVPEAIEDARRNARLNGHDNVRFYTGRAEQLLPQWARQGFRPDVIVVDPPRAGCDRKLLDAVLSIRPRRFVYVSCNPATLAKDCDILLRGGFRLETVQPVDMFPQTAHVECCVSIVRK
jgi:23S rRNA (uracil1939-C5)-methyltransferase